jgi:hypothetical protein
MLRPPLAVALLALSVTDAPAVGLRLLTAMAVVGAATGGTTAATAAPASSMPAPQVLVVQ